MVDERRIEAALARRVHGRLLVGRADASATTGGGHVARITSLLAAWRELGGRATLASRNLHRFWRARARAVGVEVVGADDDLPAASLCRLGADAVVVDGYGFGTPWLEALATRLPLLRIDDFVDATPRVDVLVDANLALPDEPCPPGVTVLRGPRFALLRDEFRHLPERAPDTEGRVLVSFGSSDPARLTVPAVEALLERGAGQLELDVIAGPAMEGADRARLDGLEGIPGLTLHRDVERMAPLLLRCSIGLIAGGTTVFELLACGTVPVAVRVADNQVRSSAGLASTGLGLDLGWHADLPPATLADQVLALAADPARVRTLSRAGREAVDGRGVWRAIEALMDRIEARSGQSA